VASRLGDERAVVTAELAGRVALVTGGASGLGAAIAKDCAVAGATVVVADIDIDGAERVVKEITADGGRAEAVSADVTVAGDVARAVDVATGLGPVRALVLSAAIEARGGVVDCTDDEWQRVLDVDLKGPFLTMRAAVPAMRAAGGGSVVAMGSPIGLAPAPGYAVYATAKGALVNLCKQVAIEHAVDNVRVNVLSPSAVDVGLFARVSDASDDPAARRRRVIAGVPMKRLGTVAGVCAATRFLLSDLSDFLTGAVVPLDGGMAAQRA
jgi:NAD(P)-dependent dehydrogenase (short-subunit alcohol dehydrogenase family)